MDLETENHLAALLMEEARRLRREADKDGVHVYLHKPNVRGRPNSRFLTATVLGVEQANRATEISEMWRAREKERELDAKKKHESKGESKRKSTGMHVRNSFVNDDSRPVSEEKSIPCSFDERQDSFSRGNAGLDDDELEEFLHSRMKRGRGSIGCRMDEPGPYLTSTSTDRDERIVAIPIERYGEECMRSRTILGPEKPHFLKSRESHDGVGTSKIQTSKKYHYEEKTKSKREKPENNKTRKESKSKHRKEETNGDHRKSKHKKVR